MPNGLTYIGDVEREMWRAPPKPTPKRAPKPTTKPKAPTPGVGEWGGLSPEDVSASAPKPRTMQGLLAPEGWHSGFWPWETPTGEGFIAPWTKDVYQTPEGLWTQPSKPTALAELPAPEMPEWLAIHNATRMAQGLPPQTEEEYRAEQEQMRGMIPEPLTYEDALAKQQRLGPDYYIDFDEATGGYTVDRKPFYKPEPTELTPSEEKIFALREEEFEFQKAEAARKAAVALAKAESEEEARKAEAAYRKEMLAIAKAEAEATAKHEQALLDLKREEIGAGAEQWRAELAAEREQWQASLNAEKERRLAELRANPASWLEYAALAGQVPAIQPWMLPLGYQEYGFELGEGIPGWSPGAQGMGLPELQTPSAQYLARMSPSAQAQFAGYRGARTGQTPSDIQFQLWAGAPPGRYGGLRQVRWER